MQVGRPSCPACSSARRTRSTPCTASCSAVWLPLASAIRKRFWGFFRISGLVGDPVLIPEPVLPRLGLVSWKVVCSTIFAGKSVALVTADQIQKESLPSQEQGFEIPPLGERLAGNFHTFWGWKRLFKGQNFSLFLFHCNALTFTRILV